MKFLLPVGGVVDRQFGILTSPGHKGVPSGIVAGMDWAVDAGCLDGPDFVKRINIDETYKWLSGMSKFYYTNLFVAGGDYVGDAKRTLDYFPLFHLKLSGWPLAFCAQDGQEALDFPTLHWETLFVGGTTEWKCSEAAVSVIKRAQALGKHIHIGRVNWRLRYSLFRGLEGSDEFTCDGTRTRYQGTQKTIDEWSKYQTDPYSLRLDLSGGDSSS